MSSRVGGRDRHEPSDVEALRRQERKGTTLRVALVEGRGVVYLSKEGGL